MTLLAWCLAWVLDFVIGDPQNWPHPVRWIGNLISIVQRWVRRICRSDRALRIGGGGVWGGGGGGGERGGGGKEGEFRGRRVL